MLGRRTNGGCPILAHFPSRARKGAVLRPSRARKEAVPDAPRDCKGAPHAPHAAPVLTAAEFCERLRATGLWMLPTGHQRIRTVTHLDVSTEAIDLAIEILAQVIKPAPANP